MTNTEQLEQALTYLREWVYILNNEWIDGGTFTEFLEDKISFENIPALKLFVNALSHIEFAHGSNMAMHVCSSLQTYCDSQDAYDLFCKTAANDELLNLYYLAAN